MKSLFLPDRSVARNWYTYWCPNACDFVWNQRWKFGYLKDETTSALTHNVWRNLWIGPFLITNRVVTLRPEEDVRADFDD